jgi:hypothetical protein
MPDPAYPVFLSQEQVADGIDQYFKARWKEAKK